MEFPPQVFMAVGRGGSDATDMIMEHRDGGGRNGG